MKSKITTITTKDLRQRARQMTEFIIRTEGLNTTYEEVVERYNKIRDRINSGENIDDVLGRE